MKNCFIFLFILLILPSVVFTSEIITNDDDDADDIVDISNLSVHIGGGVIFLIGLVFLVEMINMYSRIGAAALPPQTISTNISTSLEQYPNDRWKQSFKFTINS